MTKQIEDYPLPQNLEDWLNTWNTIPKASARAQFVEMQQQIDSLTEQNKELQEKHEALRDQAWLFKQFMGKIKTVIGFGHSRSTDELKLSALELVDDYNRQFNSNAQIYANKESK